MNLPLNASKAEVKNAYHKLALEYHPDVSKHPKAAEKFIEINMAYQSIIQKMDFDARIRSKQTVENDTAQEIINSWMAAERDRIRKRAQQHSDMRYNQFRKSKLYKSSYIFPRTLALFSLFLGLSIIFGSVYGSLNQYETDPRAISVNYIISGILVFLLGVTITSFSISRLCPYLRRNQR